MTNSSPEPDNVRLQRMKIQLYLIGFAFSIIFYLIAFRPYLPAWENGLSALALLGFVYEFRMMSLGKSSRQLNWLVILIVMLAITHPIMSSALSNNRSIVSEIPQWEPWPVIFLCLFGARILSEHNDLRLFLSWSAPSIVKGSISSQSSFAAVAVASILTIAFYNIIPSVFSHSGDPAMDVLLKSLRGDTFIHISIIFIFFINAGYMAESAFLLLRARRILTSLRSRLANVLESTSGVAAPDFESLCSSYSGFASIWASTLLASAYDEVASETPVINAAKAAALNQMMWASKNFITRLAALQPMLGFFGTIIGLSTTLSALPSAINSSQSSSSGGLALALGGLAIKFQTTLLGLIAGGLSSFFLGFLERGEASLNAEALLLINSALPRNLEGAQASASVSRMGD